MSTINIVKYYFHKDHIPRTAERMHQLVALAYQTARDRQLYPRAVFIRSDLHATTSINGVRQQDPKGLHVTLCYKDNEQLQKGTHIACHGYVNDEESMSFREATHAGEKPDSTKKKNKNRTAVWPSEDKLYAAPEIGYGHWN
ncbi:hypothetical protein TPAR_02266 [Tolypocladium paradoxum]|uniref:Uncharacterized protein n=1 Tax=Tolypocladium paradoxum TaxID=94208 RepID=A0A2S4L532_9HYPO|nr:hypothetical protein TPAR_02266 [Tolypocladium paradoxum]